MMRSASPTATARLASLDGFQARPAQPVDGRARDGHGQPGEQHGHAADVAVVLAGPVGVAEVHVVDRRRDRARDGARAGPASRRRGEVVGSYAGRAHRRSCRSACVRHRGRVRQSASMSPHHHGPTIRVRPSRSADEAPPQWEEVGAETAADMAPDASLQPQRDDDRHDSDADQVRRSRGR